MPPSPALRVARAALLLAAVAVPLVTAAVAARRELAPDGIGIDDAYITQRYGRNLADGHGWVWNPGGERVEGSTSTLWTLAAAGAYRLTRAPDDLLFALALALVAIALALWLRTALPEEDGGTGAPAATALAALALGLDLAARPSFAVWTAASLMDGGVWCAALLLAAATLARAARPAAGAGPLAAAALAQAALALARPEALLAGPALIAAAALGARVPLRRWAAPAAAALLAQGALVAWRLTTFGWPLPNTYYAKVDATLAVRLGPGAEYLRTAARSDPTLVPLGAVALGVLLVLALDRRGAGRARLPEHLAPALALAAAGTLLVVPIALLEGGDFFTGHRTVVQLRPFAASLLLLLASAAFGGRARPARARTTAAGVVALAAAVAYVSGGVRWGRLEATTRHAVDFAVARGGAAAAATFNRIFGSAHRPPALGVLAAGALPLAYRGPSRDLLGLNDVAIAHATRERTGLHGHSAFSAQIFFEAPPEVVFFGPAVCLGEQAEHAERRYWFRHLLAGLDRDPRFRRRYRLVDFLAPTTGQPELCTFARADWLDGGASGVAWRLAAQPPPLVAPAPAGGAGPSG